MGVLASGCNGAGERLECSTVGPARRRPRHERAPLLIAATALEHGLTVVTRNLRHFTPTGVATLDPWQGEG